MKNNIPLILLCSIIILLLQISKATAEEKQLPIYLLIGQSNMAGRAKFIDSDKGPIENVYLLNANGKWETAEEPLNKHSNIHKGLNKLGLGPGAEFARTLLSKKTHKEIGLIVNARGGSNIGAWQKKGKFYKKMLERAQPAIKKNGYLAGILWLQGESDPKNENYLEQLQNLVVNLRMDLKSPNVPFIACHIFHKTIVNPQIDKLPNIVKNTSVIAPEGRSVFDRIGHYDRKSVLIIGKAFAEKMIKMQTQ